MLKVAIFIPRPVREAGDVGLKQTKAEVHIAIPLDRHRQDGGGDGHVGRAG
jgi:hypothetical protein